MEEERDLVTFSDEDGNEFDLEVIDYFDYEGQEYAALIDAEPDEEGNKGCIVCQVVADTEDDGEESESFIPVEDEALAQKLVEIFNTKMADEEKEDE